MNDSHPLLPGPRPPSIFLPASFSNTPPHAYPPLVAPDFSLAASGAAAAAAGLAPRRWAGTIQAPNTPSRGGYTSPDPSPTTDRSHDLTHGASQDDGVYGPGQDSTGGVPTPVRPGQLSIFAPSPMAGGAGAGGGGGTHLPMPISPDTPVTPDAPEGLDGLGMLDGPDVSPHAQAHNHTQTHTPPYLTRPADASGGVVDGYFGHEHGRHASYPLLDQHQHHYHHPHQRQHDPHHHQHDQHDQHKLQLGQERRHGQGQGQPLPTPHHQHHAQTHDGVMMGSSLSTSPPAPAPLGLPVSLHRSLSMPHPPATAHNPIATIAATVPTPAPMPVTVPALTSPPFALGPGGAGAAIGHSSAGGHKPYNGALEVDPFYYPTMPPHLHSHPSSYDYAHHPHHPHAHAHAHAHTHQARRNSVSSGGGPHARRGSVKKADGKQQTFLPKLFQEQPEYHHIIRWDEAGEVIIIEKPDELTEKILPLVFRQTRFASFSRQLNIYGFMRKVSLRHVDRGICDPDASTWSHPFLRRTSDRDEIEGFKRRVPPRPSQAAKRRASIMTTTAYHEPTPGLSPTSSEASFGGLHPSPPDPYTAHLLPDVEEHKPSVFGQPPSFNLSRFDTASAELHSHGHAGIQAYSYPHAYSSSPEDSGAFGSLGIGNASLTGAGTVGGPYAGQAGRPIATPAVQPAAPILASPFAFSAPSLFSRAVSATAPVSAPANIHGFSPDLRISQGHIRTRSVQGEPPSAMISGGFSPSSPQGHTAWTSGVSVSPVDQEFGGMDMDIDPGHGHGHECPHQHGDPCDHLHGHDGLARGVTSAGSSPEPVLRGTGGATPTYDPEDPNTWIRRGWTDLATGAIVPPPSGRDLISRELLGSSPASLPSDFAPGGHGAGPGQRYPQATGPAYVSPVSSVFRDRPTEPPHALDLERGGGGHGMTYGHVGQHDHQHQHAKGRELHGGADSLDDLSPKTVSPGVYQSGFSLPAFKTEPLAPGPAPAPPYAPSSVSYTRSPRTPRTPSTKIFASRLDRRGSLSTSPYSHAHSHSHSHAHSASPRAHPRPQLSLGPLPIWRPSGLGSVHGAMNVPSLGSVPGLSDMAGLGLDGARSPRREGDAAGRRAGGVRGGESGRGGSMDGGWERNDDMDEALPSAGLEGLMRGPFDGVLPVGEDDVGMEMA